MMKTKLKMLLTKSPHHKSLNAYLIKSNSKNCHILIPYTSKFVANSSNDIASPDLAHKTWQAE